jgi:heptosyltransferase-2
LLPAGTEYDGRVRLPVGEADLKKVRELLRRSGVIEGTRLILLAPGASYGETKRWPAAYYLRLAELLGRSEQAQLALVGTKAERQLFENMKRESRVSMLNLAGETSLGELLALSSTADLFVGNDSGAAHVAAASGCPVIVVVGSSDPEWTTPRGDAVEVVYRKVSCSPCFLKTCPYGLECLTQIEPEAVCQAADRLRKRSRGAI